MPIEGVNSSMTALQFAAVRARSRTVEMSAAASSNGSRSGHIPLKRAAAAEDEPPPRRADHRLLPDPGFHWVYRSARVNGRHVAKRVPQRADTDYWFLSFNSLG